MPNTLRIKRGLAAGLPNGSVAEPLFTIDTYDLYVGKGDGTNQRFQKYIASGNNTQVILGNGTLGIYTVGTVTSVGLSAPTGFTVSNTPITTSGTIALAFASGYSLPTNTKQGQWDTAYTNRITSLTTSGSSGAATLVSNTLNIPNYTLSGLGGVPSSRTLTINGTGYDLSADRSWSVGTITSLTGEATASGSGAVSVTLNNASVIGKVLTGLNLTGGGTIAATDSILQAFGKVQNQISALVGSVQYEGVWNASTNSPTITSGTGSKGDYYVVNVAGSTTIDGISDWKIGDWIIFNGTTWDKVDNTDAVSSVNGFTGAVSLSTSNIGEGTNLYFTNTRAQNAITLTTSGTSGSATYSGGTLNIPTYSLSGLGGVPSTRTLTINGTAFDLSANRSWSVGTVTSVGLTAPTGFTVSNSPITSSGNIALAFAAGYSLPTTASQTNWDAAYNDKINSAAVTGTTTKTLTLTQQDGGTITASWTDLNTDAVTSVFGRTGAVVATSGDYNTSQVTESGNLYYTNARARASLSFSPGSGAYNSTTGVITIPTNTNQLTNGANYITLASLSASAPLSYNSGTGAFTISQASTSTSGFLSSTDWNTFNNKQNALTNPVTGTGTINYIPKFTGTSTIGNSVLYDASGSVGLNTLTPALNGFNKEFTVSAGTSGTARGAVNIQGSRTSSSTFGVLGFYHQANYVAGIESSRGGDDSSGDLEFFTSNTTGATERLRISSTGNVSIGNTNNTYKLDVTGDARFTSANTLTLQNNTAVDANEPKLIFANTTFANNNYANIRSGNGGLLLNIESASTSVFTNRSRLTLNGGSTNSITFAQSTDNGSTFTTRMTLDASGNLGLGVTPSAWGSNTVAIQLGGSVFGAVSASLRLVNLANAYTDGTDFRYINSGVAALQYRISGGTGAHEWYTAPSGTAGNAISFTQAMTLFSDGNLALNTTTNSGYKLDVNGTGRFNGALSGTSATFTGGYQGRYFKIYEASEQRGGFYTYNVISGAGTDYSLGLFSESSLWFAAGGGITKHLTIASTGAATFSSSVTATSFLKTGGTASQILAANGSVITAGANITISGGVISTGSGGVVTSEKFLASTATYTLISTTASQRLFNISNSTGVGAISVNASKTYFFECMFRISNMSSTSGGLNFDLKGDGTAGIDSVAYTTNGVDTSAPTNSANTSGAYHPTVISGPIVVESAGTQIWVQIKGIFRTTSTGGTIIPSVQLKTAAAAVVANNAFFKLYEVGSNTANYEGQ